MCNVTSNTVKTLIPFVQLYVGMGFGAFDEDEQERREEKKEIETTDQIKDSGHNGDVSVEGSEDTDELLDQLQKTK